MVVDTNLNAVVYTLMVENIADNYFDKGVYRPHIGRLNAMRQFWNECVKESDFDTEHDHECINVYEIADVIGSPEFAKEFNKAISCNGADYDTNLFTFAHVFADAMEIVEWKMQSVGVAVEAITSGLQTIIDIVTPAFDKINLDKLAELADHIKDEDFPQKVVEAYEKSNRIEDIANRTPAEKPVNKPIPLHKPVKK